MAGDGLMGELLMGRQNTAQRYPLSNLNLVPFSHVSFSLARIVKTRNDNDEAARFNHRLLLMDQQSVVRS